jgi:hypothetical protein
MDEKDLYLEASFCKGFCLCPYCLGRGAGVVNVKLPLVKDITTIYIGIYTSKDAFDHFSTRNHASKSICHNQVRKTLKFPS